MANKRGFASKLGFILSMAAFCIGPGNLWKFPATAGKGGGGAFLLIYILFVAIIGFPLFMMEVTLGRSAKRSGIAGMRALQNGKKSVWGLIGWLGVLAIFIIDGFATMIFGWGIGYMVKALTGGFQGLGTEELGAMFGQFAGSGASMLGGLLCTVIIYLSLVSGVKKGVEKFTSILMPIMLAALVFLAVYANMLPGASEGLKFYLTPDFSKVSLANTVAVCAPQVFFSIGIGMACAFTYGSYFGDDEGLPGAIGWAATTDTGVAILSGLICVPALFAFGVEPTAGPTLVFITLPQVFNSMGAFGAIFGGLYMLCFTAADFTSIQGGTEALIANLCDLNPKLSRKKAAAIICTATFAFSIFFHFTFRSGFLGTAKVGPFGLFDFADFLSSGVCLPIGAVIILAFVIFKWGWPKFKEEANRGAGEKGLKVQDWMKPWFFYVLPVLLLISVYFIFDVYL